MFSVTKNISKLYLYITHKSRFTWQEQLSELSSYKYYPLGRSSLYETFSGKMARRRT